MNQADVTPEAFAGWAHGQLTAGFTKAYARATTAGAGHDAALAAAVAQDEQAWPLYLWLLEHNLGSPYGPWRRLDRPARRRAARVMDGG